MKPSIMVVIYKSIWNARCKQHHSDLDMNSRWHWYITLEQTRQDHHGCTANTVAYQNCHFETLNTYVIYHSAQLFRSLWVFSNGTLLTFIRELKTIRLLRCDRQHNCFGTFPCNVVIGNGIFPCLCKNTLSHQKSFSIHFKWCHWFQMF